MHKQQLRENISASIVQLSLAEKEYQSRDVSEQLLVLIKERDAQVIMLYNALADEVDVRSVMSTCLEYGKTVLLPRIANETDMDVYHINSLDDCDIGAYGILEPEENKATIWTGPIDLGIVPGRVFDRYGGRIGRGRGYYDRFLKEYSDMYTIGVCFVEQIVDNVPMEEWDVRMDRIIYCA